MVPKWSISLLVLTRLVKCELLMPNRSLRVLSNSTVSMRLKKNPCQKPHSSVPNRSQSPCRMYRERYSLPLQLIIDCYGQCARLSIATIADIAGPCLTSRDLAANVGQTGVYQIYKRFRNVIVATQPDSL